MQNTPFTPEATRTPAEGRFLVRKPIVTKRPFSRLTDGLRHEVRVTTVAARIAGADAASTA